MCNVKRKAFGTIRSNQYTVYYGNPYNIIYGLYVCIGIAICVRMYVYVYIYIYIYTYTHLSISLSLYIYIYKCTYTRALHVTCTIHLDNESYHMSCLWMVRYIDVHDLWCIVPYILHSVSSMAYMVDGESHMVYGVYDMDYRVWHIMYCSMQYHKL